MRVGIVRSDVGKLYLSDVENKSQRNFSSQPKGQSRYLSKPTDAQLATMLGTVAFLTTLGSVGAATFNTAGTANGTKLNIKTAAAQPFTQITVTSGAAVPIATIVADLNRGFTNAGLGLHARADGTNHVAIDTTAKGPGAYFRIDAASPSAGALQTVLGITVGVGAAVNGLTIAALKTAVYPTAVTVNVATATITALSTFANMASADKTALVTAIANTIAPRLVETGFALRSFAYGVISKVASSTYQPGGARIGLPAGIGAAVVADDGSTPFTL
jgi:hypothetical protein